MARGRASEALTFEGLLDFFPILHFGLCVDEFVP